MITTNTIIHRLKTLAPLLIFDITFIFGYVVWCSTPGYLLFFTFIPQIIFRSIYYVMGREIVLRGCCFKRKDYLPVILVQILYLLFSFSVEDGADVGSGVFFSLINLPGNLSGKALDLSILLLITLVFFIHFYFPKANTHELNSENTTAPKSLFFTYLRGFFLYPFLSFLICMTIMLRC